MKLSEMKQKLLTSENVNFKLENGSLVPAHFHVTEVGIITKSFIDCGGKVRKEKVVNFQLWAANDYEHCLKPKKLLDIIALSERVLGLENLEIEVEYQSDTIGKYELGYDGIDFILLAKKTNCLAKENCAIPLSFEEKSCCSIESNCC